MDVFNVLQLNRETRSTTNTDNTEFETKKITVLSELLFVGYTIFITSNFKGCGIYML